MKRKYVLWIGLFSVFLFMGVGNMREQVVEEIVIKAELVTPKTSLNRVKGRDYSSNYSFASDGNLNNMSVVPRDSKFFKAEITKQSKDSYRMNVKNGTVPEIYYIEQDGQSYSIKYKNRVIERRNLNFKNKENIFNFMVEYLQK